MKSTVLIRQDQIESLSFVWDVRMCEYLLLGKWCIGIKDHKSRICFGRVQTVVRHNHLLLPPIDSSSFEPENYKIILTSPGVYEGPSCLSHLIYSSGYSMSDCSALFRDNGRLIIDFPAFMLNGKWWPVVWRWKHDHVLKHLCVYTRLF